MSLQKTLSSVFALSEKNLTALSSFVNSPMKAVKPAILKAYVVVLTEMRSRSVSTASMLNKSVESSASITSIKVNARLNTKI